ncbi:MAG: M56 family metallopeptidase [Bacteroidales bacterium]|nr:M56 family metallopeptidase [Bacteroidales bacterium]MDT8430372.1 M56 family metallopeptidase [Bacteroidales bacterium]
MREIITYLVELNITIAVFFGAYLMLFRKDSNFGVRRAFLLLAMVASFVIPLLSFNVAIPTGNLNTVLIVLPEVVFRGNATGAVHNSTWIPELLSILYIAVGLFFAGRLALGMGRILIQSATSEKTTINGTAVLVNKELHASSFFNLIFIDPEKAGEADLEHIIEHESFHARLGHSADRIMAEVILCISWFNPVIWMLRKAIVVNHEYQADIRVIERGTDQVSYQLTILNQYIGSASISNQFSNQIKNRIIMINKKYKKGSSWKGLMLVPVSIVLLFFMACGNEEPVNQQVDDPLHESANPENSNALIGDVSESIAEEVFYIVEEMPQWPGSDDMAKAMQLFVAQNLKYPEIAKANNVEGKVFVHFMVTSTGKVVVPDPDILPPPLKNEDGTIDEVVVVTYRALSPDQETPDEEAVQALKDEGVRVVELMPDLVPGKQRGKNVNVLFTMPITFKLQ